MVILSSLTGITLVLFVAVESVNFHRSMVCRQRTWLASAEFATRDLLSEGPRARTTWIKGCGILLNHRARTSHWTRRGRPQRLSVNLRGNL